MRRRYYKRTQNRDKYSVEHTTIHHQKFRNGHLQVGRQWAINILPP